jgi:hypothetical protein
VDEEEVRAARLFGDETRAEEEEYLRIFKLHFYQ